MESDYGWVCTKYNLKCSSYNHKPWFTKKIKDLLKYKEKCRRCKNKFNKMWKKIKNVIRVGERKYIKYIEDEIGADEKK